MLPKFVFSNLEHGYSGSSAVFLQKPKNAEGLIWKYPELDRGEKFMTEWDIVNRMISRRTRGERLRFSEFKMLR